MSAASRSLVETCWQPKRRDHSVVNGDWKARKPWRFGELASLPPSGFAPGGDQQASVGGEHLFSDSLIESYSRSTDSKHRDLSSSLANEP
jgi:hypothetical protein